MKKVFFLGGIDAEMNEIISVLKLHNMEFYNKNLGWGAAASAYKDEIDEAIKNGEMPCLIELEIDISLPQGGVIIIDHHDKRAGQPASILQVLNLLGLEPTRWQQLIAANDSAYIPGMIRINASEEEIAKVRAADRSAQGITSEQEEMAEEAISNREEEGLLTVVHLPHSKCATVTDRLFGQYDNLLILSEDGEVNFFGDGALCATLKERFKRWNGGSGLGQGGGSAYWGGYPNQNEVEKFIREYFVHE